MMTIHRYWKAENEVIDIRFDAGIRQSAYDWFRRPEILLSELAVGARTSFSSSLNAQDLQSTPSWRRFISGFLAIMIGRVITKETSKNIQSESGWTVLGGGCHGVHWDRWAGVGESRKGKRGCSARRGRGGHWDYWKRHYGAHHRSLGRFNG